VAAYAVKKGFKIGKFFEMAALEKMKADKQTP
jgi:hypothetical protein